MRVTDSLTETPTTSVVLRREVARRGLFERPPGAHRTFRVEAVHAYMDLEPQLRLIGAAIRARALVGGKAALERLGAAPSGGERPHELPQGRDALIAFCAEIAASPAGER